MLKPRCLVPDENGNIACLGHSAEGYLTPCCWIDAFSYLRGNSEGIFYQKKFLISNNDNIIDITQSKEWIDFYTMLQEEPNKAPPVCYKMCSDDSVIDNYGEI